MNKEKLSSSCKNLVLLATRSFVFLHCRDAKLWERDFAVHSLRSATELTEMWVCVPIDSRCLEAMERNLDGNQASLWILQRLFDAIEEDEEVGLGLLGVSIPTTILFQGGLPDRVLSSERYGAAVRGRRIDSGSPKMVLNVVLEMASVFQTCLVWYYDGLCEEMEVKRLFEMFCRMEWHRQVVCIQGYIESSFRLIPIDYPNFSLTRDEKLVGIMIKLVHCLNDFDKRNHQITAMTAKFDMLPVREEFEEKDGRNDLFPCLRFVEHVSFRKLTETNVKKTTVPRKRILKAVKQSETVLETREAGIDLAFGEYVEVFGDEDVNKLDIFMVDDCFPASEEDTESLKEFCESCSRILRANVHLVRLFKDSRTAAEPPSNVLLSNWLQRLIQHHRAGRESSPVLLVGIGVGANVIFHLCAFRKLSSLCGLISINGFANVDAAFKRCVDRTTKKTTVHPEAKRILAGEFIDLRNSLKLIHSPLVIVQSTESVFVAPTNVQQILNARLAPKMLVNTIRECFESKLPLRSTVVWLRSAHTVVSERRKFMERLVEECVEHISAFESTKGTRCSTSMKCQANSALQEVNEDAEIEAQNGSQEVEDRQGNEEIKAQRPGQHIVEPSQEENEKNRFQERADEHEGLESRISLDECRKQEESANKSDAIFMKRQESMLRITNVEPLLSHEERSLMMDEDCISRQARRAEKKAKQWSKQQKLVETQMEELQRHRNKNTQRKTECEKRELQRLKNLQVFEYESLVLDEGDEDHNECTVEWNALPEEIRSEEQRKLFFEIAKRQAWNIERSKTILEKINTKREKRQNMLKRLSEVERAIILLENQAKIPGFKASSQKTQKRANEALVELSRVSKKKEELRDALQDLERGLKDLDNDISKVNSRIQTDAVILKKREQELDNFVSVQKNRAELLEKEHELGIMRRAELQKMQRSLASSLDSLARRKSRIQLELERCKKVSTQFCDSDIWQEGVLQRIKTNDLREFLAREEDELGKRIDAANGKMENTINDQRRVESRLAEILKELSVTRSIEKRMNRTLQMHRGGKIKEKAFETMESQKAFDRGLEDDSKSAAIFSKVGERNGFASLAEVVRSKPHRKRSAEEKRWAALDFVIGNDQKYWELEEKSSILNHFPEDLRKEDIELLFTLPEEVNLALPYIKSETHLEAYKLIQKYTHGNNLQQLVESDDAAAIERRIDKELFQIYSSIEEYQNECPREPTGENYNARILVKKSASSKCVYEARDQKLRRHEGRIHSFVIPETLLLSKISVHLVFEGDLDLKGYHPARISAALFIAETEMIGICSPKHDLCLSSKDHIGRFSIVHQPSNKGLPLPTGKYRVVVAAASSATYSVSVFVNELQPLDAFEVDMKEKAIAAHVNAKDLERDLHHLDISLRLSERKVSLIEKLVSEAKDQCSQLEASVRAGNPEISMENLECDYEKWARLFVSRQNELNSTMKGTSEILKMFREIQKGIAANEKLVAESLESGIIQESDLDEKWSLRVETPSVNLNKEEREDTITNDEVNVEEFWAATLQVLHSNQGGGSDAILSREELLAVMCHDRKKIQDTKILLLQSLLRSRAEPQVRDCILKPMLEEPRSTRRTKINFDVVAASTEVRDLDLRCREVFVELEKAYECKHAEMDSLVLHTSQQRFPIKVLRRQLNRELDQLLLLQVKEREVAMLREMKRSSERQKNEIEAAAHVYDMLSSSDEEDSFSISINLESLPVTSSTVSYATSMSRGKMAGTKDRERNEKSKSLEERQFCRACRFSPCRWRPCYDNLELQKRVSEIRDEYERIRGLENDSKFVETFILKSVQRSGKSRVLKRDALRELSSELRSSKRKQRLLIVDEELHKAFASSKPFIETEAIHGYKQVQWTENVIRALQSERERIIASEVVCEVVDGALKYMLEGWHFGEIESFEIQKPRADTDFGGATGKHNAAAMVLEGKNETPVSKWLAVTKEITQRQKRQKVVHEKHHVAKDLNSTEATLRFGMFSLTLMYFRAMILLRNARHGQDFKRKSTVNFQRENTQTRKLAMEIAMSKARAGERKKIQIEHEKRYSNVEILRVRVKQERAREIAAKSIQRYVRGHFGRKVAKKMALCILEQIAEKNLQIAAAVAIQRVFRGHTARVFVEDLRRELIEFIASVRLSEAHEEEEEFLRRHPLRRFWRRMRRKLQPGNSSQVLND